MNSSLIQLLVLAGIAIFLVLRLRGVLGTREGFEKPTTQRPEAPSRKRPEFEVIEGGPDRDITDHVADDTEDARALAAMKMAEPGFSVSEFLQGAGGAYEMILMAFENGDVDGLRPFLSPEVMDTFEEVIRQREADGLTIEATFVGLRELALHKASFDRATAEAEITVRFGGELTSVVRDADGQVVEGSPTAIKTQRDTWTFARKMGSADPNWLLVATGG